MTGLGYTRLSLLLAAFGTLFLMQLRWFFIKNVPIWSWRKEALRYRLDKTDGKFLLVAVCFITALLGTLAYEYWWYY